jgi:hypothetical protein
MPCGRDSQGLPIGFLLSAVGGMDEDLRALALNVENVVRFPREILDQQSTSQSTQFASQQLASFARTIHAGDHASFRKCGLISQQTRSQSTALQG